MSGRSFSVEATVAPESDNSIVQRYILFPLADHDIYKMYQLHVRSFWKAEEIDYTRDANDWNTKLTIPEQDYIASILGFFAGADGVVIDNLVCRFLIELNNPDFPLSYAAAEIRQFYSMQLCIEAIHTEVYSKLIENCVPNILKQREIFKIISSSPSILRKVQWAQKWMNDPNAPFAQRLVAFICVEGIFFSSSFAGIFWLKERGILRGITSSNEFISRDEQLHVEFAEMLYSKLPPSHRLEPAIIRDILKEACDVELSFVADILPVKLAGLNAALMSSYVRYITDRKSILLGAGAIYGGHGQCPLPFMVNIGLPTKDNFFEYKSTQYCGAADIHEDIGHITGTSLFDELF